MADKQATKTQKPKLRFGEKWDYAPAPEAADHFTIADRYGLFLDGEFVEPNSGEYFATTNPATEETVAEVALAEGGRLDLRGERVGGDRFAARPGVDERGGGRPVAQSHPRGEGGERLVDRREEGRERA